MERLIEKKVSVYRGEKGAQKAEKRQKSRRKLFQQVAIEIEANDVRDKNNQSQPA
jgi:hypothetical protein